MAIIIEKFPKKYSPCSIASVILFGILIAHRDPSTTKGWHYFEETGEFRHSAEGSPSVDPRRTLKRLIGTL